MEQEKPKKFLKVQHTHEYPASLESRGCGVGHNMGKVQTLVDVDNYYKNTSL